MIQTLLPYTSKTQAGEVKRRPICTFQSGVEEINTKAGQIDECDAEDGQHIFGT